MPKPIIRRSLSVLVCAALGACSLTDDAQSVLGVSYQDADGGTHRARFSKTVYMQQHSDGRQQPVGYVDFDQGSRGEIYYLFDAAGKPMNTVFMNGQGSPVNPHSTDIVQLREGRRFDFYEIGKGRISHVEFTAPNAVCRDWHGRNAVRIRLASNYYLDKDYQSYYVLRLDTQVRRGQPVSAPKYETRFVGVSAAREAEWVKSERQGSASLALSNLREKITILANVVCASERQADVRQPQDKGAGR